MPWKNDENAMPRISTFPHLQPQDTPMTINPSLSAGDPFLLYKNVRQFECRIDKDPFDVYELHVEEDLFSSFTATVTLVAERRLESRDLLGKTARVTLRSRTAKRYFHGMVCEYEELPVKRQSRLYKVTVVSELWALTRIRNVRIFQDMTVPQIIEEVLKDSRIFPGRYEMKTRMSYAPREYCVQYRETNWEFIRRLLAEEGMFVYHEFSEDRHVPVFTDCRIFHKKIPGASPVVIFSKKGQLVNFEDHITAFQSISRLTVETIRLRDFDFQAPSRPPEAHAEVKEKKVFYSIYDYPGYLDDEPTAFRLGQVRLERETWKKRTFKGEGVCRMLTPGHTFTLSDHPRPDYDAEYTVVSVIHDGKQPQVLRELGDSAEGTTYGNAFTCIPADVTFRPEPLPKPSVRGIQSAMVTGPPNEEIYVDKWGRIKVKFPWDLLGQDERTSCWVRVSQIWAGACESIFTPRIGQEVLVDFLDGDPDRPVVIGTVFNSKNMPPYPLPQNKTRSTIKTRTVKGEGFNELRFEDKRDEEEIYLHGQKDWNIEILNDKTQVIGHDEKLDVKNDRSKTVGHDQKEEVKNDKFITVDKNHTESVGENMSVTVGKNLEEHTTEYKTVTVGKNLSETVSEDTIIRAEKNRTLSIGENSVRTIQKRHTEQVGDGLSITVGENGDMAVGKNYTVSANDKISISAGREIVFTCGSSTIVMKSDGKVQINGTDIAVLGNGNVVVKGRKIGKN
jgi:type VI secretion system secreted protein VgrG